MHTDTEWNHELRECYQNTARGYGLAARWHHISIHRDETIFRTDLGIRSNTTRVPSLCGMADCPWYTNGKMSVDPWQLGLPVCVIHIDRSRRDRKKAAHHDILSIFLHHKRPI
ncbi:hypothetical protein BaRGS_00001313 [Batillaria attramentaria]|uniref:Uncharacterized protein n=1 Tax=Batillaria attramentaria TaxID=370345 RepID=A0ABD0M823_9CAEN